MNTMRGLRLDEEKVDMLGGPQVRYTCELCKFTVDLTRLHHEKGREAAHLVDMTVGVVLEHIVPHTESLLSVIMAR